MRGVLTHLCVAQVFEEYLEYGRADCASTCYLVLDVDSLLGVSDLSEVGA
jgi:hypothetical protein